MALLLLFSLQELRTAARNLTTDVGWEVESGWRVCSEEVCKLKAAALIVFLDFPFSATSRYLLCPQAGIKHWDDDRPHPFH